MMVCLVMGAQGVNVQRIEGGVSAGITMPLGGYHDGERLLTGMLGMSLRYNIKNSPWDCGVLMQLDCSRWDFWHDPTSDDWQNNRTLTMAVTGAYNFRQGRKVNPYAGVALGMGFHDNVGDVMCDVDGCKPVIMPQVGVEFFHHVRLNAHMQLSRRGFNTYGLSLGLVLGGRPKK